MESTQQFDDSLTYSFGRFIRGEGNEASLIETRALDVEEFTALREAADVLKDLNSQTPFRVLVHSWFALRGTLAAMSRVRTRRHRPREFNAGPDELKERVMSVLANYLGAGRMYIEATDYHYGRGERLDAFRSMVRRIYDDSPAYRFTYALRNAYLHTGAIPMELTQSADEQGAVSTAVKFYRDQLLSCGYQWKSIVRADLQAGPEVIDLLDILGKSFEAFVDIEYGRVALACRNALGALEVIESSLPSEDCAPGEVHIIWATRQTGEKRLQLDGPIGLPDRSWMTGLKQAVSESAELSFIKPPQSAELTEEHDPLMLPFYTPALDIMDAWHVEGASGAHTVIMDVLRGGPGTAQYALVGLANMVGYSMLQVEMTMGVSLPESLARFREGGRPADDPWRTPPSDSPS